MSNRGLQPKFTISEYYDCDQAAFYAAIQAVREHGIDLVGWLEYFVEGLATQLAEVRRRGEQAIRRDVLARKIGLSERQAIALCHVMEHGSLMIQDYEARHGNVQIYRLSEAQL